MPTLSGEERFSEQPPSLPALSTPWGISGDQIAEPGIFPVPREKARAVVPRRCADTIRATPAYRAAPAFLRFHWPAAFVLTAGETQSDEGGKAQHVGMIQSLAPRSGQVLLHTNQARRGLRMRVD